MTSKYTFNMVGGGFSHAFSSCGWDHPSHVIWDKSSFSGNVSVHIDDAILTIPPNPKKMNIAWMAESPFFNKRVSTALDDTSTKEYLVSNYKYIFSCDLDLINKHPELTYTIPTARPWVKIKQIFPKTKWTSIIASAKKEAPGHLIRHDIIRNSKSSIDVYGGGYKPIEDKGIGLNDYLYSFVIENIKINGYFTEKISDCFATGTIPIYWGDERISNHFLEDGIIRLQNGFDYSTLTDELYKSKLPYIKENFDRILQFPLPEDYIYINYIK